MQQRDDLSIGREAQGDLVCTQCARVAGRVKGPNSRQGKAEMPIDPLSFDREALRPRRGRPLKSTPWS